ncbi:hypothetical protein PUN28_015704 [Cardiocondyla obscurior]|uniref:Uncharacterized protein n=1 Tax=Cardiocondyla obscurior TaxID=286306 RepID=A0AAW2EUD8_9HYME
MALFPRGCRRRCAWLSMRKFKSVIKQKLRLHCTVQNYTQNETRDAWLVHVVVSIIRSGSNNPCGLQMEMTKMLLPTAVPSMAKIHRSEKYIFYPDLKNYKNIQKRLLLSKLLREQLERKKRESSIYKVVRENCRQLLKTTSLAPNYESQRVACPSTDEGRSYAGQRATRGIPPPTRSPRAFASHARDDAKAGYDDAFAIGGNLHTGKKILAYLLARFLFPRSTINARFFFFSDTSPKGVLARLSL